MDYRKLLRRGVRERVCAAALLVLQSARLSRGAPSPPPPLPLGEGSSWRSIVLQTAVGAALLGAACAGPAPSASPPRSDGTPAANVQAAASVQPAASAAPPAPLHAILANPSPGVIFLPYYLGQARGLYQAEGLDLDLQVLPANTAIAAILAGEVDFTSAAGSAGRAAATGSPLRVFMGLIDRSMISLHVRPEIGSVAELRGQPIAVTSVAGTIAQVGRRVFEAEGFTAETDVQFVQTPSPPHALSALLAGGVVAALLDPPYSVLAAKQGFRVLAEGRDYVQSTQGGLATSERLLREQPEKIQRAIRGSLRSISYTLAQEEDAVAYIAQTAELSPEDARATYRVLVDGLVRDGRTAPGIITAELQAAGADATAEQVMDFGPLRAVLAEPAFRDLCAPSGGVLPAGCRGQ